MSQPSIVIRRPSLSFEELCAQSIARLEAASSAAPSQLRAVKMAGGGHEMIELPLDPARWPASVPKASARRGQP